MGQRHQLFVIAKIANRYRSLAVFHHQWLYGATALKRCLGLLAIFSDSANRLPIQQELTAARRFDEDFWTKPRSYNDSEVPFPFITTCLLLGASFDVKEGYNASVILEPFNMAFNDGDNNDGITVIDITDLRHVRYCFVLWGFYERAEDDVEEEEEHTRPPRVPQMTPLSGPMYLGAYSSAEERSKHPDFQTLMQQYHEWDLIDIASLADTWPQGKWVGADTESKVGEDNAIVRPAPSLRESALARLVETSLQNADLDLSWLTEAELLSDFLPAIKARIYSEPTLLAWPAAKYLLLKAVQHDQEVDLSPFQDLSMDEIISFTSRLSDKTISLSLSGNVTTGLLALLAEQTSLRKVYVLDAPNLQLKSVLRLMCQPRMPWIYHADIFRAPLQYRIMSSRLRPRAPAAEDQRTPQPLENETTWIPEASVNFPVVQIIWLSRELITGGNVSRFDDGGLPWATSLPPPDRDSYLSRHHPSVAAFPLRDAYLTTARAVTGLVKFMQCLAKSDNLGVVMSKAGTMAIVVAKCFALTASDLGAIDTAKQVEVGPLPEVPFTTAREMIASSAGPPAPDVQPLKPREWTIILAHEPRDTMAMYEKRPSEEKLRYAFITAASGEGGEAPTGVEDVTAGRPPDEVIIADMESFLQEVVKDNLDERQALHGFWLEATRGLADEFGVCGKEEINSILEAMPEYSKWREPLLEQWRRWTGMEA